MQFTLFVMDTTRPAHIVPARDLVDDHTHEDEDSLLDRGLDFDLRTVLARRNVLRFFGGASVVALTACGSEATTGSTTTTSSSSQSATAATPSAAVDAVVPDETAGPYPGDGSNGANVLDDSGIIRSDITSSFGTSTTKAEGIPTTINLTVTDSTKGYAAMAGVAVYLWHCNRDGRYSMYSQGVENENYLRGVQPTDAKGTATFTSIFPACYDGRWPHIHFEVYRSTAEATSSGQIVKTSQIALPQEVCAEAYAASGYEQSVANLGRVSLSSDNVFGNDGGVHQLASVTGDASSGYVVNLTIGV